jgi:hypothetical protein
MVSATIAVDDYPAGAPGLQTAATRGDQRRAPRSTAGQEPQTAPLQRAPIMTETYVTGRSSRHSWSAVPASAHTATRRSR